MIRLRYVRQIFIFILFFNIIVTPCVFAQDAVLTVEWDANRESDLAGYRVYWGTAPRRYSDSRLVDTRTKCTITGLKNGVRYFFAITALDFWGNESPCSAEASAYAGEIKPVEQIILKNNYPNPFNPGTFIEYELPEQQNIEISVYNRLGQKVKILETGTKDQGSHAVYWNGLDETGQPTASGLYFYRLKSPGKIMQKNMLLLH